MPFRFSCCISHRMWRFLSSAVPVLAATLAMFIQTAEAQTTTGNSTTGTSLWTSKGCSGCHASSGSTKANAMNAGGHITHANTQGMGGQSDSGGQYNDIAAYLATLFTDLAAQSVTHNTAKTITIPNFSLNTSYGDYVGLRAVTSPARGSVSYTLGSLDITYTPTTNQCGTDSFTYEAYRTVNTGTSNTRTVSLTIANPSAANISGSSGTISGTVGSAITSYTPTNSGGTATSYAITSGTLPGGLSLNTSTGVISGTPTASGTSTVTLTPYNCSNGTINGQTGTGKSITITLITTPGAPTIGTATPGNASLSVTFTAPASNGNSSITGYTATCGAISNTGSASPIVVSGLTNGTSYSCSVTATNAAGTGSASGTTSGTPRTVPGTPTIGTATAGTTSASVTFTAPASNGGSTITGYTATCGSGSNTGTASPITVSGLAAGTAVTCSVLATNAAGNGSSSTASNSVTPYTTPGAPTIGTATPGNGSLGVSFTAPASNGFSTITGYTATCGGFTGTGTASPITVSGLTNGTSYSCSVTATNAAGTGTASGTTSGTPRTVPGAPTIGSATAGSISATVTFTAPGSTGGSAITGYTATCGAISNTGSASPLTVSGLTAGTAVTCTVTATNAAGTGTASAVSNSVTPYTVPDAPTIGTITPGNGQLGVAFTAPASNGFSTITGYTATCGAFSGSSTSSPITVSGLTNGTSYSCSVTATNAAGNSAASSSASGTPATVPGAPTIGTVTAGNAQISVTFTAPASNGGSTITAYTATCGAATGSGISSPVVVTGLVNGTSYSCTVKATNSAGTGVDSAASASVTPQGTQTITFGTPPSPTFSAGGTFSVSATGGASGNAIVFSSLTTSACTVSGTTVTMLALGSCTIAANQAGNTAYAAAAQATQTIVLGANGYLIKTIAGGGTVGDDVAATTALLNQPRGIVRDLAGNLYVAELGGHRVRRIAPDGKIYIVAGTGTAGFSGDGGAATSAQISSPRSLAIDAFGNLLIADTGNNRVRQISPNGTIATIAGTGSATYSGDGGAPTSAGMNPWGVAVDSTGNIYIAELQNNRIRKISGGVISTVVGTGVAGNTGDGGPATSADIDNPQAVAVDVTGNIYVASPARHNIRKVNTSGTISLFAGTGTAGSIGDGGQAALAQIDGPVSMSIASDGTLFIADTNAHRVRKITSAGVISTHSGTGTAGFSGDGGAPALAQLNSVSGVFVTDSDTVWIADQGNHRLRFDDDGEINTIAGNGSNSIFTGDGEAATSVPLNLPHGLALDSAGNLYVTERGRSRVRKISPSGVIGTLAGSGTGGFADGTGTAALFNAPRGMAIDATGTLYVADASNHRIRAISPAGVVTTIAGTGTAGYNGDGINATLAQLNTPVGIGVSSGGDVYATELTGFRVRKISGGLIATLAGTGISGYSGDNGPATSAQLRTAVGVSLDYMNASYIADSTSQRVRKVDLSGNIATIAGNGSSGTSGDGGAAELATLNSPSAVGFDSSNNIYIGTANTIRRVDAALGTISTFAGTGTSGFSGDGGAAAAATLNTVTGIVQASDGSFYIADTNNNRVRKIFFSSATVPGAPVLNSATAGNEQIVLDFSAPASNGGSSITLYRATCGVAYATGTASPITVSHLVGGTPYSCSVTATNDIGTGTASNAISATPISRASAPLIGTASGGINQISVSFSAPLNNGGSTITGYRAICGPYASTGVASPVVVTGIPGGTSFSCQVAAITVFGDGTYSSYSNAAAVIGVPGAPTGVAATAGNAQISVAFTAPSNIGGSAITGYTATCGAISNTGSASPIVVSGLTNGTAYTCTVSASNAAGASVPSAVSNSVTPSTLPAAPVIGSASTAGTGSVSVAFSAPDDGGAAISSYTATCGSQSANGSASPIVVSGLTVGVPVTCTVVATNTNGSGPASAASNSVTPISATLVLQSVGSRKTHGAAGDFDLPVDTSQTIGGAISVEPRAIGAGHTIVFQFDSLVISAGTVTILDGNGQTAGSATTSISGDSVVVVVTGIVDNSRAAISLSGVNGSTNATVAMGFLVGDVNGSRAVNATDIAAIKARSGQTTSATNFRFDLNASGAINATDIAAVKARSGQVIP